MTLGQAFILGGACAEVIRIAVTRVHGYVFMWRLERDFQRSKSRMLACKHVHTRAVNVGSKEAPFLGIKCLNCWAIRYDGGPFGGEWNPNSAPPERFEEFT